MLLTARDSEALRGDERFVSVARAGRPTGAGRERRRNQPMFGINIGVSEVAAALTIATFVLILALSLYDARRD